MPEEQKKPEPTPLEKAEVEVAEYKAGWQRAVADYKNLQREVMARQAEWAKLSERQILEEFIPVYDHLKLAINNEQLASKGDPWVEGVRFVLKQFADIFKNHGVEEIQTVGEQFNPAFHESAGEQAGDCKAGTILKEVIGGYKMGDRVIRPARVIITK